MTDHLAEWLVRHVREEAALFRRPPALDFAKGDIIFKSLLIRPAGWCKAQHWHSTGGRLPRFPQA
jgi:hypothetical protein